MLDKIRNWLIHPTARPMGLVQVEVSLKCNLDCVMCPWVQLRSDAALMSMDTYRRVACGFPQARGADLTGGGEPLLNANLCDMVALACEAGCQVGFSTNGYELDQPLSQALLDAGLTWISFSIDAASAETYEHIRRGSDFERVVENMRAFHRLGQSRPQGAPKMMLVFVIMQSNLHELPAMIDLARKVGASTLIAKNLDVILKGADDHRRIFSHGQAIPDEVVQTLALTQTRAHQEHIDLRLYRLMPREQPVCEHDPLHSTFITWDGRVAPCITLAYANQRYFDGQPTTAPTAIFGDIHTQTFEAIWNSDPYQTFRRQYQRRLANNQRAALEAVLGQQEPFDDLPPAPKGCQSCYYLYGV